MQIFSILQEYKTIGYVHYRLCSTTERRQLHLPEDYKVKDIALEMSWHLLCFSFNSERLFYILSEERSLPGTQFCRILYRPNQWSFLDNECSVEGCIKWPLAKQSYSENNRLNSELPEHKMKECRAVLPAKYKCKRCSALSEAWAIYCVSPFDIRRCCLKICRACKPNYLLLSILLTLSGMHNCGRVLIIVCFCLVCWYSFLDLLPSNFLNPLNLLMLFPPTISCVRKLHNFVVCCVNSLSQINRISFIKWKVLYYEYWNANPHPVYMLPDNFTNS